ncbi:MAG: diversity-generating retroelement protein Avd [Candidatus Micrarchaeia archaeon]
MLDDLIIFRKAYELLKYLYPVVEGFPKSQRFLLAQRLECSALAFLEHVMIANAARDKSVELEKADLELEKLRLFARLSHEYNFIGIRQYEAISKQTAELGRLLGGWKAKFSGK